VVVGWWWLVLFQAPSLCALQWMDEISALGHTMNRGEAAYVYLFLFLQFLLFVGWGRPFSAGMGFVLLARITNKLWWTNR